MIAGNGLPWWGDRQKRINWFMNQLMVGDALVSHDLRWRIAYLFLNSKIPQYIVYRDSVKVFPIDRPATTKKDEIIKFILSQDPEVPESYLDHTELKFVENGCIDQMTDQSDITALSIPLF